MIENILDSVWIKILDLIHGMVRVLDFIFEPFNALGPGVAVFVIAAVAVVVSTLLTGRFKTRRYRRLKKEFQYWYNLRQEALKCDDPEKAKGLTKNIDQGKLNEVYYNYFFEGLLNSLATRYLPILTFMAYVNETYKPDNLMLRFGMDAIFRFRVGSEDPIIIGALFWFVISLLMAYLILWRLRRWKKPGIRFKQRLFRFRGYSGEG